MKTKYYVNGTSIQMGLKSTTHSSKLEAIKKAQDLIVSHLYYYISVVSSKGEHIIDFSGMEATQ